VNRFGWGASIAALLLAVAVLATLVALYRLAVAP